MNGDQSIQQTLLTCNLHLIHVLILSRTKLQLKKEGEEEGRKGRGGERGVRETHMGAHSLTRCSTDVAASCSFFFRCANSSVGKCTKSLLALAEDL